MKTINRIKRLFLALVLSWWMIGVVPAVALADDTPPADSSTTQTTAPASNSTPTSSGSTDSSSTPPASSSTDPSQPNSGTQSASDPSSSSSTSSTTTPPAGPTQPVGPQNPTGPTQPVGPQNPTGPQAQTGSPLPAPQAPAYAFNDATGHWEPTLISTFTWDDNQGAWQSPFYRYDSRTGWYHTIPGVTPSDAINNLTAGSHNPAQTLADILGSSDPQISGTGANSTNNAADSRSNQVLAELLNNATVTNGLRQSSTSGNATVDANTFAGSATSGAASVVANLLNLLNAMWTWTSGGFTSFIHNIFGNQTGDINLFMPSASSGGGNLGDCSGGTATTSNTGSGSANTATSTCANNLAVNSKNNGSIDNELTLNAQSGNASVTRNTHAGNAVSGDALAELNIVNLINTAIGADQTFFGMINIFGDLNGDILFPQLHLNGALGSAASLPGGNESAGNTGTGANSTNTAGISNNNSTAINNSDTNTINNNIQAQATTGSASVNANANAGNAITGQAQTNSSVFNLFGRNIFGDNAVLVIVNNMGHWVGSIMNLFGFGSSGGGALATSDATVSNTSTGANSTNNASVNNSNTANINNTNTGSITNNVKINATSGDATVAENTNAGNAQTGNATVASNVANIVGSQLSFRHIFGILIINVFGDWTGSFGVDTAAGNAPDVSRQSSQVATPTQVQPQGTHVAGIGTSANGTVTATSIPTSALTSTNSTTPTQLLSVHQPSVAAKTAASKTGLLMMLSAGILILAGAMAGLERKLKRQA